LGYILSGPLRFSLVGGREALLLAVTQVSPHYYNRGGQ
jgi:hypothetical protein